MDFSLIWTILAGTNVVHISRIGCTSARRLPIGSSPLYMHYIPVLGEVHVVGLSAALVAGDAPAGQRHQVILELVVELALPGQAPHADRVCREEKDNQKDSKVYTVY